MASEVFSLDIRDLIKLRKFYKRAPHLFARATASMLNSFAFGTRKEAIKTVKQKMNVRNDRFVNSRMRVEKARGSNILQQEAVAGSIESPRFSGWEEQELGTKTQRSRVANVLARGGDFNRQIKPSLRLKPSRDFQDANDYPGKDESTRTAAMINSAKLGKLRRPFIIGKKLKGKLRTLKAGLYRVRRKKLERLQSFEPRNPQPKRIRWMTIARKEYFKKTNIKHLWGRTLERILK
jgi:hypothetical protein